MAKSRSEIDAIRAAHMRRVFARAQTPSDLVFVDHESVAAELDLSQETRDMLRAEKAQAEARVRDRPIGRGR